MARGIRIPIGANLQPLKKGTKLASKLLKGLTIGLGAGIGLAGIRLATRGIAGLGGEIKKAINEAADFEQIRLRLEAFTGSAAAAQKVLAGGTEFALETPFETKQVLEAIVQLLGAGIKDNVVGLAKELGAVAKNGEQLAELADATAKGFAKGKFQTEELNKFLERGINLMPELEKVTGKSGSALTKLIEKGLQFKDVRAALAGLSAEGGQFEGLLKRQSRTFTGLVSTLKSGWDEVLRKFAQPILDRLKPLIVDLIAKVKELGPAFAKFGRKVGAAIAIVFQAFKEGKVFSLSVKILKLGFLTAVNLFFRGVNATVAFLTAALPPVLGAAFAKIKEPSFWKGLFKIFAAIGNGLKAALLEAIAQIPGLGDRKDKAAKARIKAIFQKREGIELISAAGGVDFGVVLKKSLFEGSKAAGESFKKSSGLVDPSAATAALRAELSRLNAAAAAAGKAAREATAAPGAGRPRALPAATAPAFANLIRPVVTSLARVGGAVALTARAGRLLNLDVQRNRTLDNILEAVRSPAAAGGGPAVFA